ncbi:MAG: hypothetical protein JWP19_228 [Rhodoglobus sp.]|nr:hypothetical protein [Rhodoglobus sp.]
MDFEPGMMGFGWFGHLIGVIVGALFCFFMVLVVIGLLFLFVRFLLVATTAAKIYVAKNSPARPVTPAAASTAPAATKPTTTPTTLAKPATKPRTTKPPTA